MARRPDAVVVEYQRLDEIVGVALVVRRVDDAIQSQRGARFEQLERREVFNATYHGGALLPAVEVQGIDESEPAAEKHFLLVSPR